MAFNAFLIDRWSTVRSEHPADSRRQIRLRIVDEFWRLPHDEKLRLEDRAIAEQDHIRTALESLDDEEDEYDTPGIGIVVRTDFTNNDAWASFCDALRDAERDILADSNGNTECGVDESIEAEAQADSGSESEEDVDTTMQPATNGQSTNGQSPIPPSIFVLVDPAPESNLRPKLTNSSNIRVLRLFNDASVVIAPSPPAETPRVRGNRLIDNNGYVEVYSGNIVWVYDAQSNVDRSVRLVSQRSEEYGTATGDSWRPRVSFLPELQINLFTGAIKINFGGLDRWDYGERQRNVADSDILL